jgi:hypothetical protein
VYSVAFEQGKNLRSPLAFMTADLYPEHPISKDLSSADWDESY